MTTTSEPVTTPTATEAAALRSPRRPGPASGTRVDVPALQQMLLGRWPEARSEARRLVAEHPELWKKEGITKEEHREITLAQMKQMVPYGHVLRAFPVRLGGRGEAGANLVGFEELVAADPSLQIKAGVQWGLFAPAIHHLGTEEQQDRLLPGAMDLSVPGAFAMTETGHGSDVASIGTTATYDPATEEFVLNTPFRGAWKQYLGNAAEHGIAATVFAQLITNGVDHGVHCFYVPIRDPQTMEFLPGVGGEDDDQKGGLNGIDNGKLHFTNVRVPRRTCSPATARWPRTAPTPPRSTAPAAASSPCWAPWCRAACPSTARRSPRRRSVSRSPRSTPTSAASSRRPPAPTS